MTAFVFVESEPNSHGTQFIFCNLLWLFHYSKMFLHKCPCFLTRE